MPRYVASSMAGMPGVRGGDLDDHIGRELAEADGLRQHGFGVAVVARIGLDGEASVAPLLAIEDRLQQRRRLHRNLFHDHPSNLVLSGQRVSWRQAPGCGPSTAASPA
jgi:hypothetical protein